MSRLLKAVAVTAALLLGVTACGADQNDASVVEEPVASDIVDVAVAAGAFPTLVAALGAADLVDTLKGDGPFTVFAPTEEAFAELLEALGVTAGELLANTELLTSVLLHHVVPGKVMSADLAGASELMVTTVQGGEVSVTEYMGSVTIDEATVVTADIEASNGVIHVIDKVLLPVVEEPVASDIVDLAVASGAFPTLVAALGAADLVDTLKGDGPFTVFAPTEEAFAELLEALGVTAGELLANTELLTSVLLHHVVPGKVMSADLAGASELMVTTVQGGEVSVTEYMGSVTIDEATVVTADIEASNGVIHVIDKVLLP
ncbi:MAG: fasciclin domain-containing protein [Acidimicrobiales bacterium]|nr:fasciclin domain-containing protein [Acidimicrobiales bacterium]